MLAYVKNTPIWQFSIRPAVPLYCLFTPHDFFPFFRAPDEGGKRDCGTAKVKVIAGLSVNEERHPRFLKMEIANNLKSDSIVAFAEANIEVGSTISSDAYSSYKNS